MGTRSARGLFERSVRGYFQVMGTLDAQDRRDIDALMGYYHDDIDYEIPYLDHPIHMKGKDEIRAFFEKNQSVSTNIVYNIKHIHVDVRMESAIMEMTASRLILPGKIEYTNRYVFIFWFKDGKFRRLSEYANPLLARAINERLGIK